MSAYQRQAAALARQQAAVDKAREAQRLAAALHELLNIHRQDFPTASRPIAPMPPLPNEAEVRHRHEKGALAGISVFKRSERAAAKQQAAAAAGAEIAVSAREAEAQRAVEQEELDRLWQALLDNDPDVVLATLSEAFEDNEAAAAAVGVMGDEVSIVVAAPEESMVPERLPGTTQAGNLTLRRLGKGDRAALYTLAVMGHVLVTLRETFAVTPGIGSARVVVLRNAGADAYGRPKLDCLLAGRWTKRAFNGVQWAQAEPDSIAQDTATELLINLRGGKELRPLDLRAEPAIRELLERVDTTELLEQS
jgi:hypothetical protein